MKIVFIALAGVAQCWVPACVPKGGQFDSWSVYVPGMQAGPQLGECERQLTDVSLPLFLPPFPSL